MNFPALLTVKTIPEIVDLLKESPYGTIAESVSAYERLGDPALLEARLDKIYYENLWQTIDKLPDAKKIKALLGTEIDLRNLELILALKYIKLEPSAIGENVIELMYRLREKEISRLVQAYIEDLPKMTVWPPYSELLREAIELARDGKTAEMQSIFLQHLYKYAQQVSLKNPNSLVYVFSYLLLCQREARNLTTLAIGKQMKISDEKLSGLLFL